MKESADINQHVSYLFCVPLRTFIKPKQVHLNNKLFHSADPAETQVNPFPTLEKYQSVSHVIEVIDSSYCLISH